MIRGQKTSTIGQTTLKKQQGMPNKAKKPLSNIETILQIMVFLLAKIGQNRPNCDIC